MVTQAVSGRAVISTIISCHAEDALAGLEEEALNASAQAGCVWRAVSSPGSAVTATSCWHSWGR